MEKILAGKVILFKWTCHSCGYENLGNEKRCESCNSPPYDNNGKIRQLTPPLQKRNNLMSRKYIAKLIENQLNRCYWCNRLFGTWIRKNNKFIELKAVIDHKMPCAYFQDDSPSNLVAACQVCNLFKTGKIKTEEEHRGYILGKWLEKLNKGAIIV